VPGLKVPAKHVVCVVALANEKNPTDAKVAHSVVAAVVALLYDPASHGRHAVARVKGWYHPPTQSRHTDAANVDENLPAGHAVHTPAPAPDENVPGSHAKQLVAGGWLTKPGEHPIC
jgi:hypothetical protein